MEEKVILILDENESYEDGARAEFENDPRVRCSRCKYIYRVDRRSAFFAQVLESAEEYPPPVHFWECCVACRADESTFYHIALLADGMIEKMANSEEWTNWFQDEVSIVKRWNMSKAEILDRSKRYENENEIAYILK